MPTSGDDEHKDEEYKATTENTPMRCAVATKNVTSRSKKRQALSSPPTTDSGPITRDDIRDIVTEILRADRTAMLAELRNTITTSISSELKTIREEIQDVKDSMAYISKDYDDLKEELTLSSVLVKNLESQNKIMENTIINLTTRVNQMEQHARSSNIEMQCVPEYKSENLMTLTKQLGSIIGCQVTDDHILNCTRVAKLKRDSDRPRSIVVQFCSPKIRDSFLAASIEFNKSHADAKLNSSHIGIAGEKKPIYIMEHLSPTNKAIHAAARTKAKAIGYKFVWVRGGRVLMRKDDTSEYRVIKDIAYLDKLV